jgi:hypothetical protein
MGEPASISFARQWDACRSFVPEDVSARSSGGREYFPLKILPKAFRLSGAVKFCHGCGRVRWGGEGETCWRDAGLPPPHGRHDWISTGR